SAAVLHADETSWRVNGVTYWLWGFCTTFLCYFLIDPHRSSAVVARVLGEVFDGFLVCDFYAAGGRGVKSFLLHFNFNHQKRRN
ncbi:IS66 family transposase, partial [Endothiovibrio diazotrophicus]